MSQEVEMKMRDKIKFQKPEEISLEEIQGGENGELNKVKCVLLMVIRGWRRRGCYFNRFWEFGNTASLLFDWGS